MADAQRFRPYSDKPKAQPLPDHVAEEIVNTVNGLQVYEEELAKNTTEQAGCAPSSTPTSRASRN